MSVSVSVMDAIWQAFLQVKGGCLWGKPDLRNAVTATNAWIDSKAAEYNAALPQPFRGTATTDEKTLLLALTMIGKVSPPMRAMLLLVIGGIVNGS